MFRGSDRFNVTTDGNIIHSLVNALSVCSFKINCEYGASRKRSLN